MPVTKGEVQIYYETRGPRDGAPLLLIQGLSWQMIGWREGFCQKLVDAGVFVIMHDNRDVGLSQKFGGPTDFDGGYALEDMAKDGFAVLDDLSLESAHVVGASMGGMIAQTMAVSRPERVRSLNLIYTAPKWDPDYFIPAETPPTVEELLGRFEREEAITKFVEKEQQSASTAYATDHEWVREHGARAFDRCYAPEGIVRQMMAVTRWGADPAALSDLNMPSSIVHGRADGRVKLDAALELARRLKTAEVHIYPGLGHEIPEPLWDDFVAIIMRTAARV